MEDLKPLLRKVKALGLQVTKNHVELIETAVSFTTKAIVNSIEESKPCERCRTSLTAALERAATSINLAFKEVMSE